MTAAGVIEYGRGPEEITMPAPQSKTQQIIDWLEEEIRSGRSKPGERIPSARQLRERFGWSGTPVRQAVDNLKARGWLVGAPGVGVFVSQRPPIGGPPST